MSTSCAPWDLAQTAQDDSEASSLPLSASYAAWDLAAVCRGADSLQDEDSHSEDSGDSEELATPTGSPTLGECPLLPTETFKIVIHECETRDEDEVLNFGEVVNDGSLHKLPLPVWDYLTGPAPSVN